MDLSLLTSVLSIIVALIALVFSVLTYLRTERERQRTEYRGFLLELATVIRTLHGAIDALIKLPGERGLFYEDWTPSVQRFVALTEQAIRWKDRKVVEEMKTVQQQLFTAATALGSQDIPKSGTEGQESSETPESVAKRVADSLMEAHKSTHDYLRAVQTAIREL